MPFGGVCFIGLILVPFTVTMSRKLSGTQTTQTVLWALTANILTYIHYGTRECRYQWLSRGVPEVWAIFWYLTAGFSVMPSDSWSTIERWISCHGV